MKKVQEMEIVRMAKRGEMYLTEEGIKAIEALERKRVGEKKTLSSKPTMEISGQRILNK